MPLQVIAMITCELGCEDGCIEGWLDGSDEGCELGSDEGWELGSELGCIERHSVWKSMKTTRDTVNNDILMYFTNGAETI